MTSLSRARAVFHPRKLLSHKFVIIHHTRRVRSNFIETKFGTALSKFTTDVSDTHMPPLRGVAARTIAKSEREYSYVLTGILGRIRHAIRDPDRRPALLDRASNWTRARHPRIRRRLLNRSHHSS